MLKKIKIKPSLKYEKRFNKNSVIATKYKTN